MFDYVFFMYGFCRIYIQQKQLKELKENDDVFILSVTVITLIYDAKMFY